MLTYQSRDCSCQYRVRQSEPQVDREQPPTPPARSFLLKLPPAARSTPARIAGAGAKRSSSSSIPAACRLLARDCPDPQSQLVGFAHSRPDRPGASRLIGLVECKMVINTFNSGASMFMADFEGANSPTWRNNASRILTTRFVVLSSYVSPEGKNAMNWAPSWRAGRAPALASRRTAFSGRGDARHLS